MFNKKLEYRLALAENTVRNLERAVARLTKASELAVEQKSPSMGVQVVDTAGVVVMEPSKYRTGVMESKWETVPLAQIILSIEENLGITLCWSQNEQKIVVYERDET